MNNDNFYIVKRDAYEHNMKALEELKNRNYNLNIELEHTRNSLQNQHRNLIKEFYPYVEDLELENKNLKASNEEYLKYLKRAEEKIQQMFTVIYGTPFVKKKARFDWLMDQFINQLIDEKEKMDMYETHLLNDPKLNESEVDETRFYYYVDQLNNIASIFEGDLEQESLTNTYKDNIIYGFISQVKKTAAMLEQDIYQNSKGRTSPVDDSEEYCCGCYD